MNFRLLILFTLLGATLGPHARAAKTPGCATLLVAKGEVFRQLQQSRYWVRISSRSMTPDLFEKDHDGAFKKLILDLSDVFSEVIAKGGQPSAEIVGLDQHHGRLIVQVDVQDRIVMDGSVVGYGRTKRSLSEVFIFDLGRYNQNRHVRIAQRVALPTVPELPFQPPLITSERYNVRLTSESHRIEKVVTFFDGGALLIGWKHRGVQAVSIDGREIAPGLFSATDSFGISIKKDRMGLHEAPNFANWTRWTQSGAQGQIWSAPLSTPSAVPRDSGNFLEIDTDAILQRRTDAISRIR